MIGHFLLAAIFTAAIFSPEWFQALVLICLAFYQVVRGLRYLSEG
jgi:hypothetical protein